MHRNTPLPRQIGIIATCLLIVGAGVYGFLKTRDALYGIRLSVDTPNKPAVIVHDPIFAVSGHAPGARFVYVNGHEIATERDGKFSDTIALQNGYNVLAIMATDRFGRSKTSNYQLVLQ